MKRYTRPASSWLQRFASVGLTLPASRDFGETGPSNLKGAPQSFLPGCLGCGLESGLALVMAACVSPG